MKKLLALVLALVMTLSLATVSTNAAFKDADEISYKEAADVMSAVGVFVGDGTNFNPKAGLNREQAAKLVAYLALGEDVAEALPAVAMFDDVAASSWAAKYIAYCADAGIITGDGAGKFYPASPVDGYAFAKMVICALGYEAEAEGFLGGNWSINVARKAKELELAKGGVELAKNLTREEAAQVMLNAIKCGTVSGYSASGSSVTIGGVTIDREWGTPTVSGTPYYATEFDSVVTYNENAHDDYGRKAHTWSYDDWSGTYADETAKFVFTGKMSAKAMAAELKGYYVGHTDYKVGNDSAVHVYAASPVVAQATNGTFNDAATFALAGGTTAAKLAALTANGKVVELYAGSDKVIDQIVVTNSTIEQVYDITTNKNTGVVSYKFSLAGQTYTTAEDATYAITVKGEVAEDDYVTVVALGNDVIVYPTTSVTGALTAFDADAGTYTIAGDAKKANYTCGDALALDSDDAVYYLDQYGYVVATSAVASTANYAYVLGAYVKTTTTATGATYAPEVQAVLSDGTIGVYSLKTYKDGGNTYISGLDTQLTGTGSADFMVGGVYKYDVDAGVMKVSAVGAYDGATDGTYVAVLEDNAPGAYVANRDTSVAIDYSGSNDTVTALMNSKTQYVFIKTSNDTAKAFVGNSSFAGYAFDHYDTNKVVASFDEGVVTAKVVFVEDASTTTSTVDTYGYIDAAKYVETKDDDHTYYTYTMTLADGSTVKVVAEDTALVNSDLYSYESDKTVTSSNRLNTEAQYVAYGAANVVDELLYVGDYYNMTADTKVVDCSTTYDEVDDASVIVWLKKSNGSVTKDIEAVYIVG